MPLIFCHRQVEKWFVRENLWAAFSDFFTDEMKGIRVKGKKNFFPSILKEKDRK